MADRAIRNLTEREPDGTNEFYETALENVNNYKSRVHILKKKVTVTAAQLATVGTIPIDIIAAPGANKYLAISSVFVSYKFNTTAYDFSFIESLYFNIGVWIGLMIHYTVINGGASFNGHLSSDNNVSNGIVPIATNTALTLGTAAGTNPSTGDGDIDIVVYYSIEDTNV